jgi:hypothetical protein
MAVVCRKIGSFSIQKTDSTNSGADCLRKIEPCFFLQAEDIP